MDTELLKRVDAWLAAHRNEIIDDLIGLVRIPSVSIPDTAVPPYGQACRDVLSYMFDLGARHGYSSHNYDNYVGAVRFSQGDTQVGIWAHLDVVPVPDPSAWDYPPFEGTLVEDRYLIGRGVQDNKMAAIGVFHVMNCLRDLGMQFRHGYTLYMGTSEETGMEDARYFAAHYPCPDLSIVPDTGFPVCCAQRGSMTLRLRLPFATPVTLEASNNPSVTPEEITAVIGGRTLTAKGQCAHVYAAEKVQVNAVAVMLDLLAQASPANAQPLAALKALISAWDGSSLDIAYADALSGALCIAPTRMSWENGELRVDLFGILPVSADADALLERAAQKAGAAGIRAEILRMRKPCSFPVDHPVVSLLTGVYNDVTGYDAQPFVMSGGNYAAYLPNAFGFGPGMPGREFPPHIFREGHGDYHQCDESEDVEHLLTFMRIYAMGIAALEQTDDLKA